MLRTGWRWSANQDALVLDYKDGQPRSSGPPVTPCRRRSTITGSRRWPPPRLTDGSSMSAPAPTATSPSVGCWPKLAAQWAWQIELKRRVGVRAVPRRRPSSRWSTSSPAFARLWGSLRSPWQMTHDHRKSRTATGNSRGSELAKVENVHRSTTKLLAAVRCRQVQTNSYEAIQGYDLSPIQARERKTLVCMRLVAGS